MVDSLKPLLPTLMWWIPLLPLAAGGVMALLPDRRGKLASRLAIAALAASCVLALLALAVAVEDRSLRVTSDVEWFTFGDVVIKVGLLLDPMAAAMVAMVTFVALCIFIYSLEYMAKEPRFGRFFGFLSLFCGAMLAVLLSNSLLLLFMAWELVGVASYLLIGFYYHKPSAAAAAQKAFITTRVGDLAFFIGMIWLYGQSGTLLFFDEGKGLLESDALRTLAGTTAFGGLSVSAAASLLLLFGAMGKSGQFPLHTWLPDAMEGPTPVSALIHAATMVAAGVFMVARCHPIFANGGGLAMPLTACAWVGGITALYASLVAVAQTDIKRILAYSTISQLGFMMVALGTGGVSAAIFHLIAHAFFKALLFLSAGSVIHGCHEEQDIRKMGGLRQAMPKTFIAYAIGMMALSGFPFVFSGFWSKEAILHSAEVWPGGKGPFLLAATAALLTAFYMSRQALMVFFGTPRKPGVHRPHESPMMMILPMWVLGAGAVLLSFIATPFWPWFEKWLAGESAHFDSGAMGKHGAMGLLVLSFLLVVVGVGLASKFYRRISNDSNAPDPLAARLMGGWCFLGNAMGVDRLYQKMLIGPLAFVAGAINCLERLLLVPMMGLGETIFKSFGFFARFTDHRGFNRGFDGVCSSLKSRARLVSSWQSGRPQDYLRAVGFGMSLLVLVYLLLSSC
jgi:NADH-quinone oxidoreductase subunit L